MQASVEPLAAIFALNTDLLANCLANLTDVQASSRLAAGGNSVAFLVAHMTDSRHHLAELLGSPLTNPLAAALADAGSLDDIVSLPPLSDLVQAWFAVSTHLARVLELLTPADLDAKTPQRYPIPGGTALDALAFLAQHDSYHLGQVAFLRRQLGLRAMTYTRSASGAA